MINNVLYKEPPLLHTTAHDPKRIKAPSGQSMTGSIDVHRRKAFLSSLQNNRKHQKTTAASSKKCSWYGLATFDNKSQDSRFYLQYSPIFSILYT